MTEFYKRNDSSFCRDLKRILKPSSSYCFVTAMFWGTTGFHSVDKPVADELEVHRTIQLDPNLKL
jgi:hypothetical protein